MIRLSEPCSIGCNLRAMLMLVLLLGCQVAMGQSGKGEEADKVIKTISERQFLRPAMFWLEDDEKAEQYLRSMGDFSIQRMQETKKDVDKELQETQQILRVKKLLVGKTKKVKKQNKRLAKYFKDVDAARRYFDEAEKVDRRCQMLSSAISSELGRRVPPQMPTGALTNFYYRSSNGFAGYLLEVNLSKKEGKGWLSIKERRGMRGVPVEEQAEEEPKIIEVEDSVFQRVRDMVEEGKLYEVGKYYSPDYMIMDASSWSMDFKFEGGSIHSGGYATGPDNSQTLSRIIDYLKKVHSS